MSQLARVSLTFTFNWKVSILTLIIVPLLVSLGLWQLDRAGEKRHLLDEFEQRWHILPVNFDELKPDDREEYRSVILTGRFETEKWFFLDNKTRKGKVGYEVLVPFMTNKKQWVIVNRGWVEGNPDRSILPFVEQPAGNLTIQGRLHYSNSQFTLAEHYIVDNQWPKVIQTEDVSQLTKLTGYRFMTSGIRIESSDTSAFVTDWIIVNSSPEKHTGYAVQWFAMAFVWSVMFISFSINILDYLRDRLLNIKNTYFSKPDNNE